MVEEWKEYDNYEFSNFGNVRRIKDKHVLKGSVGNRGYKYIQLNRDNKRKNILIHQMVAKLFIGDRPGDKVVDHIDRNKLNNNIANLRYITFKENSFNCDRVYTDIPQDTPNRKKIVLERYIQDNKEILDKKKRNYYLKNIEKLIKKYANIYFEVECHLCQIKKSIVYSQYNQLKRTVGTDKYMCDTCSRKRNLRIASCAITALHL